MYKKILLISLSLILLGCNEVKNETKSLMENVEQSKNVTSIDLNNIIDKYDGETPYISVNNNKPDFSEEDKKIDYSFESYSELDSLGRCGSAYASLSSDTMPKEKRGSIGSVRPSGWQIAKYDSVDGKYLYNRCHLIGFQLSGENANNKNLITGTRYLNVEGMLPFENMVADYIKETNNHVLYKVTPLFKDNNLIASGVLMEAYSLEDNGEGISFNIFAYNVQPGIQINYLNGDSCLNGDELKDTSSDSEVEIRGNANSKIYHCPGQNYYEGMLDSKYLVIFKSEKEAIAAGYRKASR